MPETYPQLAGESNAAYGTRLTAIALGRSNLNGKMRMNIPANYPQSPDLEVRGTNQVAAPAPSLMDHMKSGLNTLGQKAQLFGQAAMGHDPYAQPPVDPNFYKPGQDAASITSAPESRLKPIIPTR